MRPFIQSSLFAPDYFFTYILSFLPQLASLFFFCYKTPPVLHSTYSLANHELTNRK